MSEKNTGGPAFPVAADGSYIPDCDMPNAPPAREFPGHPGMTLRDWFAGNALMGMNSDAELARMWAIMDAKTRVECLVSAAYSIADAMIAEREK